MKARKIIPAVLLLILVTALTLEAALWLRSTGVMLLQEAYPSLGVDAEGSPVYFRHWFRRVDRRPVGYTRFYDEERNLIREVDYSKLEEPFRLALPPVAVSPHLISRGAAWERFDDPPFVIRQVRNNQRAFLFNEALELSTSRKIIGRGPKIPKHVV